MKARLMLAVLGALMLTLAVGSVALGRYDDSRRDLLAPGLTIGGVDVGSLRVTEARRRLQQTLVTPAMRPINVKAAGRRFRMTAKRAKVTVAVEPALREALRRSRAGGRISRTWRGITDARMDADIPVPVDFSRRAVSRFAAHVDRQTAVTAHDAYLTFTATSLERHAGRDGRQIDAARLERTIRRRWADITSVRHVVARVRAVEPKVGISDLAAAHPTVLTVSRDRNQLRLWKHLRLARVYPISVGAAGYETPTGLYRIANKQVDPAWHVPNSDWAGDLAGQVIAGGVPQNPLKARWLGIVSGVGIHGTSEESRIGQAASHGCIRMRVADVKRLYDQVPVGTPVYIG